MKQIEQAMLQAIVNRKNFTRSNTWVRVTEKPEYTRIEVCLHGKAIFMHWTGDNYIAVCNDSGPTALTLSRLNALAQHFTGSRPFIDDKGTLTAVCHPPTSKFCDTTYWTLQITQNTKETA